MTNGTSQGLFVIVAVVIFGVFVAISYSIFNGSLQPALANIFKESTIKALDDVEDKNSKKDIVSVSATEKNISIEKKGNIYVLSDFDNVVESNRWTLGVHNDDLIEIPFGHRITFYYDIFFEGEGLANASLDFNSYVHESQHTNGWNGVDNYGTSSKQSFAGQVKANTWTTIEGYYVNDNILNVNKKPIYDGKNKKLSVGTAFGLEKINTISKGINSFKIKNIKYRITKEE